MPLIPFFAMVRKDLQLFFADRIVVMDHGKVIAEDTLDGLQSRVAGVGGGRATLESVFLTLTGRSLRD